jgi:hypothetical protein
MVDGSSLLFNQVKPVERMEILSTLPPKPEVDRLIARFFDRQAFPINVPRKSPILLQSCYHTSLTRTVSYPPQANFYTRGTACAWILSYQPLADQ